MNIISVRFIGIAIFISMAFYACKDEENTTKTQIVETINFNVEESINYSESSSIVKEVEYVSLKSDNPDALFSNISKLVVKDNSIYLLDRRNKKLLLFTRDGEFVRKIGSEGKGASEYLNTSDFQINENNELILYDGTSDIFLTYDENGKVINKTKSPTQIDNFDLIGDKYIFAVAPYNSTEPEGVSLAITDKQLKQEKALLNYSKFIDPNFQMGCWFNKTSNHIIHNRPVDNTITLISTTKLDIIKQYDINFGKLNFPDKLKSQMEKYYPSFSKYCFMYTPPIVIKDMIIGNIANKGKRQSFIYKIDDKQLFINKSMNIDLNCINTPLFISDKEEVVGVLYSSLFEEAKGIENLESMPESIYKDLKDGNPILAFYKL